MFTIPEKRSHKWYFVMGGVFFINIAALLFSRLLVGQSITLKNAVGFGIISTIISFFVLPGFFGFQTYTLAVLLGNFTGITYMLYLILSRIKDGWADLTSIFSFLTLVVIGVVTGILAQIVVWAISRKK